MDSTLSFGIGKFKCMAVSDGTNTYQNPAQLFFPTADREELHRALLRHRLNPETWKEFENTYTPLLIDTGDELILVDTGVGKELSSNGGKLLQNLKSMDILPEAIDHIILTHGHPDHIGGNTTGEGQSIFTNARYHMFRDEWNFWCTDQGKKAMESKGFHPELKKELLGIAKMKLGSIEGQLELIDQDSEIVPGIHMLKAPGHTPGHMILLIHSGEERFYSFSDMVIHPIHLEHPEWITAVDIDGEEMIKTRRTFLKRAEKENALVHAFHLPFPAVGRIEEKSGGWQWIPYTEP